MRDCADVFDSAWVLGESTMNLAESGAVRFSMPMWLRDRFHVLGGVKLAWQSTVDKSFEAPKVKI